MSWPGPLGRNTPTNLWAAVPVAAIAIVVASLAVGCSQTTENANPLGQVSPTSVPVDSQADAADPADTAESLGAQSGTGQEATAERVEAVAWTTCGALECASLEVPIRTDQPELGTVELALARATSPDRDGDGVQDSIILHPGGPGASGILALRQGLRLGPEAADDFHLVAFDPRGVGAGGPLDKTLASSLGTEFQVDDLDLIRQAVGSERLHYLGLSYGSLLGLRYAEAYPQHVGPVVLDGVIDPRRSLEELLLDQLDGFEAAFAALDDACAADQLTCPAGGARAAYDRLAAAGLAGPSTAGADSVDDLVWGTIMGLYQDWLWPQLAEALVAAEVGDPTGLARLSQVYRSGTDWQAYLATICADGDLPRSDADWDLLLTRAERSSPRFAAAVTGGLRDCPSPAPGDPGPTAADPEPAFGRPLQLDDEVTMLLLGASGDPATPIEHARAVAELLSDTPLIEVDRTGHLAWGANSCVTETVSRFFVDDTVPDEDLSC
jgi:pimeloyl-ACP methyl ester carboxylesterase